MGRAHTYALYSQVTMLAFIGVCLALHPGVVLRWNEAGLSNYGVHIRTVVPYSLAFAGSAVFAVMAARATPTDTRARIVLRAILRAYALLSVFALLSTYGYTVNATLKHIHMAAGITVMAFEPLASVWLFRQVRGFRRDGVWLTLELAGLLLATIDLFALLHVLFLAQALTGVSFGVLLVHATRRIAAD